MVCLCHLVCACCWCNAKPDRCNCSFHWFVGVMLCVVCINWFLFKLLMLSLLQFQTMLTYSCNCSIDVMFRCYPQTTSSSSVSCSWNWALFGTRSPAPAAAAPGGREFACMCVCVCVCLYVYVCVDVTCVPSEWAPSGPSPASCAVSCWWGGWHWKVVVRWVAFGFGWSEGGLSTVRLCLPAFCALWCDLPLTWSKCCLVRFSWSRRTGLHCHSK